MVLKFGLLLIAYLVGSVPFSVILGKAFKGIDVRRHGSKNPGGTNSLRFLGGKVGALVIIGDVGKGAIIILLINLGLFGDADLLLHPLAYGLASAIGHAFSIFIKFKGGKAVGTTFGSVIAFSPLIAMVSGAFFLLGLKITKYVSLASTSYAFGLIIIALALNDFEMLFYVSLSALLIFFRHRSNYVNIKNHRESRISWM